MASTVKRNILQNYRNKYLKEIYTTLDVTLTLTLSRSCHKMPSNLACLENMVHVNITVRAWDCVMGIKEVPCDE